MSKPTVLPKFAEQDQVDPTSGQNNVITPPAAWLDYGWSYQEEPPRNYFNWLHRHTYLWTKWLDDSAQALKTLVAATDAPAAMKSMADYVCDGTDDHDTINTALTAVGAAGGGIVLLSPGTFTLDGTVNLVSNVRLLGSGQTATTLQQYSGVTVSRNLISSAAKTGIILAGFTLDGNKGAVGSYDSNGIILQAGGGKISLLDLIITGMKKNSTEGSAVVVEDDDVSMARVRAEDCGLHGFEIEASAERVTMDQCVAYDCDDTGFRFRGDECSAVHCIARANGGNVDIAGNHNKFSAGSALDSIDYHGVVVGGTGASVQGSLVKGNYGDGVLMSSATDAQVHGNQVYGNSQDTDTGNDGIQVTSCTACSVQGNVIRHGGGAKQHGYGIDVDAGSSVIVQGNDARNSGKTGQINDGGGATFALDGYQVWNGAHVAVDVDIINVV